MANDALQVNPTQSGIAQHITVRGSDWLWAVFAIMAFTDLVVIVWHFTIPRGQRVFHQLAAIILTTASIAYFSMASNLGYTGVETEFSGEGFPVGVLRQIWYARYIDWVITTPALLLTLVMASGLPLSDIITLVFFDLVMIVTGLIGGLVVSTYKWGFYVFGCAALFYIWWVLAGPARSSAGALGAGYRSTFTKSAVILSFLWMLYPIAWGLADGGNVISPDSEMIFYGILDVLAKPVYTLFHLYMLSKLDLTVLQLSSGKFTTSAAAHGHLHDIEKSGRQHPAYDHTTGTTAHEANSTSGAPASKKGFFSKRGAHDVTTAPHTVAPGTVAADNTTAPGRLSEATVAER